MLSSADIPSLSRGNPQPSWATKISPEQEPRSSAGPDDRHHNAHHLAPSGIEPTGTTKARTLSVSPFGVVLKYMRPLFKTRLLRIRKNILPCSVSASAPRHSLRKVSRCGDGMSFLRRSHLRHAARTVSASWASSQSTMCIGASFTTCTLASWLKCSCSSKSSSLALASPLSATPTIAPSRRDWMVSQLWLTGTRLNTSVAPLSVPFWYSQLKLKRSQCTDPLMSCGVQIGRCQHVGRTTNGEYARYSLKCSVILHFSVRNSSLELW